MSYETHTHSEAYTTSEVAEAGHVAGGEVAKVVMLSSENGLEMAVIPGNTRMQGMSRHNPASGAVWRRRPRDHPPFLPGPALPG